MQPHEFYALFEGYVWRKEKKEDQIAYFVAHLMNIEGKSLKHIITPGELVKPLRSHEDNKDNRKGEKDEQHLKEVFSGMLGGESG